jgi:hypothetical protein
MPDTDHANDPRQQAADALTTLLYVAHSKATEVFGRHVKPKALSVDFSARPDGLYGTLRKTAESSFLALWARGDFPAGTALQAWDDASDRQIANEPISWSTVAGRPWYFATPWLIPANATITVTTSAPGKLTLHGVCVYRRTALHHEERELGTQQHAEELQPKFADLMRILQLTDTLITPT